MDLNQVMFSILAVLAAITYAAPRFLMSEIQLGIDLGTTFSVAAVCSHGNTTVIPFDGARTVPSVIANTEEGLVVGTPAVKLRTVAPLDTAFNVKRLIGRKPGDEELLLERGRLPYQVRANYNDTGVEVQLHHKWFAPEGLSASVLAKLKHGAEVAQGWKQRLGFRFGSLTLTVPVSFSPSQRGATRRAASIAGFRQIRLVEEPVAAAMSYGLHKAKGRRNVLVYDLGGGTLDVALLALEDGVFRVEHTEGDSRLGGNNFDSALSKSLQLQLGDIPACKAILAEQAAQQRWNLAAEAAKRKLSSAGSRKIEVEIGTGCVGSLTNAQFQKSAAELFERAMAPVAEVLRVTHTPRDDIDEVVLVGGSTRMPTIASQIVDFFGRDLLHNTIDPDEAIAIGAASGFGC